ncbi:site-specific integrase [Methylosinus sp. H3A]|uniref:tyrosine-type recombinase/integrase n=1 Tax=Methylosinus sp. H3A TaxID=2785786 RepID=UPI00289D8AD7|nr:site-specific integrase [Methylosinus sp. H3A]
MDNGKIGARSITLQEQRAIGGLDHQVPMILLDGRTYDDNLDRFLLDLPLNGVRSRHSLRAYGYDLMIWVRFLEQACGKSVWEAVHSDIAAFHRARRRGDAGARISAASWNRSVAALDKLYRWAVVEGIVASSPFMHRDEWRRGQGPRRVRVIARNEAYERAAKRMDVRFISLEDYRVFRDVGLRGLTAAGAERPGARDRNSTRNALFAELLLTTGMRLEEASFLLAAEISDSAQATRGGQGWFELPPALTKGDRGRRILMPGRVLHEISAYIDIERAHAISKFRSRQGWETIERPIFVHRRASGAASIPIRNGGAIPIEALTPDERGRLVICDDEGVPLEPAVLWLTEVGQPVQPNTWEATFTRACRRCSAAGFPMQVSPHRLRHAFAVHMLAMLIQNRLRDASVAAGDAGTEAYHRMLGDPLQQVQRLLGHASLTTTYIYLDHVAGHADTVDAAMEELLALVPKVGNS